MLVFIVGSCRLNDGEPKPKDENTSMAEGILELSFEAETLTIPTLDNADNATSQEKIRAIPHSERSKILVHAFADGTTEWRMEKLKPKNDLSVKHLTPPSDQPETSVTRVDRSGMGSFYDAKGVLLFKHQVPVPSFLEVVKNIKENPSAVFFAMGVRSVANVASLLAEAKAKGHLVLDLGNGLVSIRASNNKGATGQARQSALPTDFITVDIYNTSLGIMIGSRMYDKQDNLLSQTFYSYKLQNDKTLVPEAIFKVTSDKDPTTGVVTKTESNTYFENVSATLNK